MRWPWQKRKRNCTTCLHYVDGGCEFGPYGRVWECLENVTPSGEPYALWEYGKPKRKQDK